MPRTRRDFCRALAFPASLSLAGCSALGLGSGDDGTRLAALEVVNQDEVTHAVEVTIEWRDGDPTTKQAELVPYEQERDGEFVLYEFGQNTIRSVTATLDGETTNAMTVPDSWSPCAYIRVYITEAAEIEYWVAQNSFYCEATTA